MTAETATPTMDIRRYRAEDRPAVEALNDRLEAGGASHRLSPENDQEAGIQDGAAVPRFTRLLVAASASGVHGGVWLTTQGLRLAGQSTRAGWIKYPVSESLVDPRFSGVPAALVLQMMREERQLVSLGLGGHHTPFARILAGLKWSGSTIPFYFRVIRPSTVLRELRFARRGRLRQLACDVAAWSGLGWLGFQGLGAVQRLRTPPPPRTWTSDAVSHFDEWSDDLWVAARDCYTFVSARDSATLNDLYPSDFDGLTRLRVRIGDTDVGWACTTRMDLRGNGGHPHFGQMVVGSIADCFGAPEHADAVMAAATEHLVSEGVDLLVSNQGHPLWGAALRRSGYLEGPSNFLFYRPPHIERVLSAEGPPESGWHLTRGDGDGPRWA